MSDGRRAPGELEGEVMAALWAADRSLAPAEVLDALGGKLAYTTVTTSLTRLHDKGVVTRERVGRTYVYAPAMDEAGVTAAQMRTLLDRGGNRANVLARFVGGLDPEDEGLLARLLGRRVPFRHRDGA